MGKNICCAKNGCCDGENPSDRTNKMMSILKTDALEQITQIGQDSLTYFSYNWKEFKE